MTATAPEVLVEVAATYDDGDSSILSRISASFLMVPSLMERTALKLESIRWRNSIVFKASVTFSPAASSASLSRDEWEACPEVTRTEKSLQSSLHWHLQSRNQTLFDGFNDQVCYMAYDGLVILGMVSYKVSQNKPEARGASACANHITGSCNRRHRWTTIVSKLLLFSNTPSSLFHCSQ